MFVMGVEEHEIAELDCKDEIYEELEEDKITFIHLCRVG